MSRKWNNSEWSCFAITILAALVSAPWLQDAPNMVKEEEPVWSCSCVTVFSSYSFLLLSKKLSILKEQQEVKLTLWDAMLFMMMCENLNTHELMWLFSYFQVQSRDSVFGLLWLHDGPSPGPWTTALGPALIKMDDVSELCSVVI